SIPAPGACGSHPTGASRTTSWSGAWTWSWPESGSCGSEPRPPPGRLQIAMRRMTHDQWRAFVMEGTHTGKLATTRLDGGPHVVPVWFVLDGDDFVFTTGEATVKGRSLLRDGRAAICVD